MSHVLVVDWLIKKYVVWEQYVLTYKYLFKRMWAHTLETVQHVQCLKKDDFCCTIEWVDQMTHSLHCLSHISTKYTEKKHI